MWDDEPFGQKMWGLRDGNRLKRGDLMYLYVGLMYLLSTKNETFGFRLTALCRKCRESGFESLTSPPWLQFISYYYKIFDLLIF
ncbi:MAG: hypothetical protein DWQ07_11205 [Chloroflexi bacterium]|nr:MAG: hypothetical protein DWQ07_11205 [Chloroflexota bacterium]MBL1192717.1 hypothetical protein [Chloroflexota bacterium]